MKIGRNDACPCGSGRKFKKCCEPTASAATRAGGTDARQATLPTNDVNALRALFAAGRYAELEVGAQALIDRHEQAGILWKYLGAARFLQGKDAVSALEAAARLMPEDAESHTNLGNALRARGQAELALAHHRRALQLQPSYADAHYSLGGALRDLGRIEEAVGCYRQAVACKPDFAMAHNNLGSTLQDAGRVEEALPSHRRALTLQPDFAAAHVQLGNALRRLGRLDQALTSYRRSLRIQPDLLDAQLQLSDTLLEARRYEEAAAGYRVVLTVQPELAQVHGNLGNALREVGQAAEAVASYRRALSLQPDLAELHNNLGNALLDTGQIEEAAASYRRALELKPDYAKAHSNLGSALRELGNLEESEASYRRALQIQPDSNAILTNLGVMQRLQGDAKRAESSLQRALELDSTSAATVAALADVYADRGRFAEAEQLYRRAHELQPDRPEAWAGIAALRKLTVNDGAWVKEAERIAQQPMRPREEVTLHFALGKYFDDIKDHDRAFTHYRNANELAKSYSPPHDQEHLSRTFEFVTQLYDREWLERSRVPQASSARPIFIVGMPRSGTSLAEQILASHPGVFGAGELGFWKRASIKVGTAAVQTGPDAGMLRQLADEYLERLNGLSADAERVVDKMPANFVHLGMIHAALPNARIIHMSRNPVDTCLSIYFQNFHVANTHATDLTALAHYYEQYLHLMAHWRAILPPQSLLDVPYEALVDDQETWSRRMLDFLGLPWDAACLDFHKTDRAVSTFSKWQVRQKINKSSVERWRNYASNVAPLMRLISNDAGAS